MKKPAPPSHTFLCRIDGFFQRANKQKKIDKNGKNLSFATCNVIAFILYLMIEN